MPPKVLLWEITRLSRRSGDYPGLIPDATGEAINNTGQVVGYGDTGPITSPFLYSNGAMVDLNSEIDPTLQIRLTNAAGINDSAQIVANAEDGDSYLLSPVPEPSTLGCWARSYRGC